MAESKSKGSTSKIAKFAGMDVRILCAILIIIVAAPLATRMAIPLVIHSGVREFYGMVDQLKPGDAVAFLIDDEVSQWGEPGAAVISAFNHLLKKNVKILVFAFSEDGPMLAIRVRDGADNNLMNSKKYGVDYVIFGYVPGGEMAMASVAADIKRALPTDSRGTPIDQLPIMANINSAKDLKMVIESNTRYEFVEVAVRQWAVTYNLPLLMITLSVNYAGATPYYPRSIKAFLVGTTQGAEYESLVGIPGQGSAFTSALSVCYLYALILMIVGGIAYYGEKKQRKQQ